MKIIVDEIQANSRLDVVVAAAMPKLSRAYIQKLCEQGRVTVNGEAEKPGRKVRVGEIITIDYDETKEAIAPSIDLPILYEDKDCIVINKPAGILTHALGKHGNEPSVASFLRDKVSGLEGDRAGIVHRLDRATSGVIIGAKNQSALSWLQKQFATRKVHKTYAAVVKGALKEPAALIDMPIERNPKAPATFRVGINGKAAQTRYEVLAHSGRFSLIELKPETGRTHQLRVHLAHIGHPIVGDPLYGTGKYTDRLFLHAHKLEITLLDRTRHTFEAPVPKEFQEKVQ
jgi:23S rRNA pseudouridine1911/1915/1917 synthase